MEILNIIATILFISIMMELFRESLRKLIKSRITEVMIKAKKIAESTAINKFNEVKKIQKELGKNTIYYIIIDKLSYIVDVILLYQIITTYSMSNVIIFSFKVPTFIIVFITFLIISPIVRKTIKIILNA